MRSQFVQDQIQILATSNTQQNISMRDIERIKIVYPKLNYQNLVANYLDKKVKSFDLLIEKNFSKLSLIQEYRRSIISAVITGKVRITKEMI